MLLRSVPEGRSDRSLARSALDCPAPKEPSRRERSDACRYAYRFESTRNIVGISCARSYRTLRDGSFEGRFPRHFVPGYYQLSLRDKAIRPSKRIALSWAPQLHEKARRGDAGLSTPHLLTSAKTS